MVFPFLFGAFVGSSISSESAKQYAERHRLERDIDRENYRRAIEIEMRHTGPDDVDSAARIAAENLKRDSHYYDEHFW